MLKNVKKFSWNVLDWKYIKNVKKCIKMLISENVTDVHVNVNVNKAGYTATKVACG